MKLIITTLIMVSITGCTSIAQVPRVQPGDEMMMDCKPFILPTDGSYDDFKKILVENKGVYESCNAQNKAKKNFIKNNF